MTTTPNEPVQDPDIVPSGDPDVGSDPNSQPGQMPEDTNTEVGA